MNLFRKAAAPVSAVAATGVAMVAGVPPELAGMVGVGAGQLVGLAVTERTRAEVVADDNNRENRARAYEGFAASAALTWQSAQLLCTVKPGLPGFLPSLALRMRTQKRLEENYAALVSSLSAVMLYTSTETQQAALAVFKTLGERLTDAGSRRPGAAMNAYLEQASLDVGDAVVVWRKAAQADLGAGSQQRP